MNRPCSSSSASMLPSCSRSANTGTLNVSGEPGNDTTEDVQVLDLRQRNDSGDQCASNANACSSDTLRCMSNVELKQIIREAKKLRKILSKKCTALDNEEIPMGDDFVNLMEKHDEKIAHVNDLIKQCNLRLLDTRGELQRRSGKLGKENRNDSDIKNRPTLCAENGQFELELWQLIDKQEEKDNSFPLLDQVSALAKRVHETHPFQGDPDGYAYAAYEIAAQMRIEKRKADGLVPAHYVVMVAGQLKHHAARKHSAQDEHGDSTQDDRGQTQTNEHEQPEDVHAGDDVVVLNDQLPEEREPLTEGDSESLQGDVVDSDDASESSGTTTSDLDETASNVCSDRVTRSCGKALSNNDPALYDKDLRIKLEANATIARVNREESYTRFKVGSVPDDNSLTEISKEKTLDVHVVIGTDTSALMKSTEKETLVGSICEHTDLVPPLRVSRKVRSVADLTSEPVLAPTSNLRVFSEPDVVERQKTPEPSTEILSSVESPAEPRTKRSCDHENDEITLIHEVKGNPPTQLPSKPRSASSSNRAPAAAAPRPSTQSKSSSKSGPRKAKVLWVETLD